MAVLGLVVVWSATCAFGLSATVNTDCGKRVLSLSPDTSRCAGAHGHDRMHRDRRPPPGSEEERGSAMKCDAVRSLGFGSSGFAIVGVRDRIMSCGSQKRLAL